MSDRIRKCTGLVVLTLLGLITGCVREPCPECPTCPECEVCPELEYDTPDDTIIDIIVDPDDGELHYLVNQTEVTARNNGYVMHPAFFNQFGSYKLINTRTHRIAKIEQHVAEFGLSNSAKAALNLITNKLEWSCSVGGTPHTITAGVAGDGIPNCMVGYDQDKTIDGKAGANLHLGDWTRIEY